MLVTYALILVKISSASTVVYVPKKDGFSRFYIDHKMLNVATVCDSYSSTVMDEWLCNLEQGHIFATWRQISSAGRLS